MGKWIGHPAVRIAAGVLAVMLVVLGVLWARCGIRGCPNVEKLKGYMPDEASVIVDQNGDEIGKLYLTRRVVVSIDSLPEHVSQAFVAMEDKRFFDHGGVDWRRVVGAAATNVRAGGIEEGSSTITMQLARNLFPDQLPARKRTLWRKVAEARVATQIEDRYTKEEILELYLNQIYFGNGAWGIEAASHEYFGKSARQLTLPEAAMLASLPRAPSRLNPRSNPEAAIKGQRIVLTRMAEQRMISAEQAEQASNTRVRIRQAETKSDVKAPYFVDAVRRQLEEELGDAIYTDGYTVHTTLDLSMQRVVEEELRRQLTAIESGAFGRFVHGSYAYLKQQNDTARTPYLQAAVVFMDPRSGDVRALVGGRDFADSEYNRATMAQRQTGSAFKPFVYAAAVANGVTPTTLLIDRPVRLAVDRNRFWEPKNYDGSYAGTISMRDALAYSKNVATVRLGTQVGIDRVIDMAHRAGLTGRIPSVPSVVLGTAETTPLNLAAAYSTFATLGSHADPRLVTRVVNRDGEVVWSQEPRHARVIDPAVAYITLSMMKDVVNRGTATAVRSAGFQGPAAGKTGTTNDAADIWFIGFTPRLVGAVWIGFDQRKTVIRGATGGELAAPVWGRIMRRIAEPTGDWVVPAGVEVVQVDAAGNALGAGCPVSGAVRDEYFLDGYAPITTCYPSYPYAVYDSMYADTFGAYVPDTLSYSSGWWDRIRQRFFGRQRDSVALPPDTYPTDPYQRDTDPRDTSRRDTLQDTTNRPKLLGRPVRPDSSRASPVPVRPDTARRDTSTKSLPDTLRRSAVDTMPAAVQAGSAGRGPGGS